MSRYIIVTNNPLVVSSYDQTEAYLGQTYLKILEVARDYVHRGHKLLTHPLAGSVKPNKNPYRTVIVAKESKALDFSSLSIIENAITVAKKMLKDKELPGWDKRVKEDFQFVDKSHIDSAMLSFN